MKLHIYSFDGEEGFYFLADIKVFYLNNVGFVVDTYKYGKQSYDLSKYWFEMSED